MINLLIQSYFITLLAICTGALFFFILGLYFIFKKRVPKLEALLAAETKLDIASISGDDDLLTTQLNLARAYIEIDKKPTAKKILKNIIAQGSSQQKEEAQQLLNYLLKCVSR
jgi:FimV-like protein